MDALKLYRIGTDAFDRHVTAIRDDQWALPTPCSEWDVRALVSHLVYETVWVAPLMQGMSVPEVGDRFEGDLLGSDPKAAWAKALEDARTAFAATGAMEQTVKLSSREVTGEEYCLEVAVDSGLHSWDLARAIGADETIPREIIDAGLELLTPTVEAARAAGAYGAAVEVPPDADDQTRLLAMIGRKA